MIAQPARVHTHKHTHFLLSSTVDSDPELEVPCAGAGRHSRTDVSWAEMPILRFCLLQIVQKEAERAERAKEREKRRKEQEEEEQKEREKEAERERNRQLEREKRREHSRERDREREGTGAGQGRSRQR